MAERHCLDRLDAYLEGTQSSGVTRRVERHLAACPSCAAVARDRARVLVAARSVSAPPAEHTVSVPVLRPAGIPGRVVVGLLTFLVLAAGFLVTVWVAGAPRPAGAVGTAADATAARATEEPGAVLAAVDALRSQGWASPSLASAGLTPVDVHSTEGEEVDEVTASWTAPAGQVVVRECRPHAGVDVPGDCAGPDDGPTGAALDAAAPATVAGAGQSRIAADPQGGGWVARLRTGRAAYRLSATLPRARAEALLAQLVAAERSGLTAVRHDDVRARIERGLGRLTDGLPGAAEPSGAVREPAPATAEPRR